MQGYMKIDYNFLMIRSAVKSSNSIRTFFKFNAFGVEQIINDCKIDTGCANSLISACNMNFGGASLDEVQKYLLLRKDIQVRYGVGVEGRSLIKNQFIECINKLDQIKTYCMKNNLSLEKSKDIIRNNMTNEEIRNILNSMFTVYRLPITDIVIASKIKAKTFGISIGFNISPDVKLIGLGMLQNIFMESFSANNEFYTLLTLPEKKYIDRAIEIGRQLREEHV